MGNKGSFKPGDKRAGRPLGTPNKATADVRAAIAELAQNNIGKVQGWLERIAKDDPDKAIARLNDLLEYHVPKLARTELTGPGGKALAISLQGAPNDSRV